MPRTDSRHDKYKVVTSAILLPVTASAAVDSDGDEVKRYHTDPLVANGDSLSDDEEKNVYRTRTDEPPRASTVAVSSYVPSASPRRRLSSGVLRVNLDGV